MPQLIRCPHCSQAMQVPENAAGKQVLCPTCKKPILVGAVPARQPVAAAASSAATSAGVASRGDARPSSASIPLPNQASSVNPAAPSRSIAIAKLPGAAPAQCPACNTPLLPGAIACMDCGYLLHGETTASDAEGPPNLCPNASCGVANPPSERTCQRCGTPLPTAPGTVLHGRYRIDKLLAMGGFGAVYLASDTRAGNRPVAIKDMICSDPEEFAIRLNFFRREAEILRALKNLPVVPQIYDLIEHGQTALLVMEYIRGQDLLKLLEGNNNQPFPVEQVVEWGKNICDVLTHMHSQTPPLVHRDLKPENIMLLDDRRTIKLIDFGTARDLGRTAKDRVAAKTRVYTEGYAPPEQIIGKPEPRSDLFALAGTFYHLVSGKPPEGFYTARELEEQLNNPAGPIPSAHRWFYELIKINLAEDVKDRYFSAREIKVDLEQRRVTKEVACPQCKQTNQVRSPYCVRCAATLTDPSPPCTNCGKINRMGSRYCIHCGNPLR